MFRCCDPASSTHHEVANSTAIAVFGVANGIGDGQPRNSSLCAPKDPICAAAVDGVRHGEDEHSWDGPHSSPVPGGWGSGAVSDGALSTVIRPGCALRNA